MIPLTDTEKTDARRFCGYSAYGPTANSFESWRFFRQEGLLEYRLNNLSDAELVIMRQYLTTCNTLEAAIPLASQNLDTSQAGIWHWNQNEVRDRDRLLNLWRRKICGFIGVPAGPALGDGGLQIIV